MATKTPAKKEPKVKQKRDRRPVKKGPHGGMLLLLVEDVPNLGKAGDAVEVKMGYGRNYLLPRGLATFVTDHNLRLLDRHKVRVQRLREAKLADLRVLAEQLQRVTVNVEANATEEGHLYGSVGAPEIVKGLKAQKLAVPEEAIRIEGAIKELGLYNVKVHLAPEIETELRVAVMPAVVESKK
jgi:large subunit ribosomal protein L9